MKTIENIIEKDAMAVVGPRVWARSFINAWRGSARNRLLGVEDEGRVSRCLDIQLVACDRLETSRSSLHMQSGSDSIERPFHAIFLLLLVLGADALTWDLGFTRPLVDRPLPPVRWRFESQQAPRIK